MATRKYAQHDRSRHAEVNHNVSHCAGRNGIGVSERELREGCLRESDSDEGGCRVAGLLRKVQMRVKVILAYGSWRWFGFLPVERVFRVRGVDWMLDWSAWDEVEFSLFSISFTLFSLFLSLGSTLRIMQTDLVRH